MNVLKTILTLSIATCSLATSMFTQVNIEANNLPSVNIGMLKANAANFEDYFSNGNIVSIYNNNKSTNLHFFNNGGMINSWSIDGNDDDQKFLVIRKPGTNQVQLQRVGTNYLITPSKYSHLAPLEAWKRSESIPFHSMQTWYVDMVPNSDQVWFKPVGNTRFGMNLPFGQFNKKLTTAIFDPNDPDQKFNIRVWSRQAPAPAPVIQSQPAPSQVVVKSNRLPQVYPVQDGIKEEINVTYTAVLISARAGAMSQSIAQVGHSTFAMVKRYDIQYSSRYSNGTSAVTYVERNKEEITTVSSPGYGANTLGFNSVRVDNISMDLPLVEKWKAAGNKPRLDGYSFRTLNVNAEGYRRAVPKSKGGYNTTYRGLLCGLYSVTTLYGCNCTTVATRMFTNVTNENYESNWNPTGLAQAIDQKNQLGDWVLGGQGTDWFVKF